MSILSVVMTLIGLVLLGVAAHFLVWYLREGRSRHKDKPMTKVLSDYKTEVEQVVTGKQKTLIPQPLLAIIGLVAFVSIVAFVSGVNPFKTEKPEEKDTGRQARRC